MGKARGNAGLFLMTTLHNPGSVRPLQGAERHARRLRIPTKVREAEVHAPVS